MAKKEEDKYVVIKQDDITKYLDSDQWDVMTEMFEQIEAGRVRDGKKENKYLVINLDEPYAEAMWEILIKFEELKGYIKDLENDLGAVESAYWER